MLREPEENTPFPPVQAGEIGISSNLEKMFLICLISFSGRGWNLSVINLNIGEQKKVVRK